MSLMGFFVEEHLMGYKRNSTRFFIEEYCAAVCDMKYLFEIFYNGRPLRGIIWNKAFMRCSQEKKISCRLIKNNIDRTSEGSSTEEDCMGPSVEESLHKVFYYKTSSLDILLKKKKRIQ